MGLFIETVLVDVIATIRIHIEGWSYDDEQLNKSDIRDVYSL